MRRGNNQNHGNPGPERRAGGSVVLDRRRRFNIGLRPDTYQKIVDLANETGTNCTIVVRNIVDFVVRHRETDVFVPFELSLIGQRSCTLQLKAPPRTAQNWKALGLFHGFMGRRGFCTWALELCFGSFDPDKLTTIITDRADLKEALETCLKA